MKKIKILVFLLVAFSDKLVIASDTGEDAGLATFFTIYEHGNKFEFPDLHEIELLKSDKNESEKLHEIAFSKLLNEGFNVLKQQNSEVPSFKDFVKNRWQEEADRFTDFWNKDREKYYAVKKELIEDNDPFMMFTYAGDVNRDDRKEESDLIYQIISRRAEDLIAAGVKKSFLQTLTNITEKNMQDIDQIQDPIFCYVMQTDFKQKNQSQDQDEKYQMLNFIRVQAYKQKWFDTKNQFGKTPLHWAASMDAGKVAKLLLDAGADINAQNNDGWTPLHWAAWKNADKVAKLLLDAGADIKIKDKSGKTPLHWAARMDADKVAKLLLDAGADINAQNNDGRTPLYWAVWSNADKVAKLLLEMKNIKKEA